MAIQSLQDVYVAELADLWSANDQMQKIIPELAERASQQNLKQLLQTSIKGIAEHTETLKSLAISRGGSGTDHCGGMEGLVQEARRHALETELPDNLRDLAIISQFQRMSHYGVAGFGTAAAYATALGLKEDATKLTSIVADIYKADDYSTHLAVIAEQSAAKK